MFETKDTYPSPVAEHGPLGRRTRAVLALGLVGAVLAFGSPLGSARANESPPTIEPERRTVVVDIGEPIVRERHLDLLSVPAVFGPTTVDLHVGPTGIPDLQTALDRARPGTRIVLSEGDHRGRVRSVRSGTEEAPIIITGPGRIVGDGDGRLIEITHDHLWLQQVTVTDADILVWVEGATGVRIIDSHLHGARSECVRLKYFASNNEIGGNRIEACGRTDFDLDRGRKNGEGVYIGTAPEQLHKNPDRRRDNSGGNWVHSNVFEVPAECVDIKEASVANRVERNDCRDGLDPDGAGFSSRGHRTAFIGNRSTGHAGAGIRLGGDEKTDGIGSIVRDNILTGNDGYGLKVLRSGQGQLCGNDLRDNEDGPAKNADHAGNRCEYAEPVTW